MKNAFVILYGVAAYFIFLISFLYAIGFVGDFIVPKTINTGDVIGFWPALWINVGLLSLFAIQHSVMARPAFKRWWTRFVPASIERSTYVLATSITLLGIFWLWQPMNAVVWEVENAPATIIIYGIFALGWLIVFFSTFMINHFDLFGLKQVYEYVKGIEPKPGKLKITFLYQIVRHPIMLGFIIAFWATPVMTAGHLLFALVTTSYIWVAVGYLEERDLVKMHGDDYREYQKKVPMLIPIPKQKRQKGESLEVT